MHKNKTDRLVPRRGAVAALTIAGLIGLAAPALAQARVIKIQITGVQNPTFGGASFGTVGQYEKIRGTITGLVDPTDPKNAVIADIANAPRNAQGLVQYTADFLILRPVDLSKGDHRVVYNITNRGAVGALIALNSAPATNDPSTAADAGNGFLMLRGYTIVAIGWDATVPAGNSALLATAPVAMNPDGSTIVGPALEEFTNDSSTTTTGALTYPAATLDKSQATLTVRLHYDDPPVTIPSTGWQYTSSSGTAIQLLPIPTTFQQSALYEFTYQAKNPKVVGLGFAAVRDMADFLRNAATDDSGNANPLAADVHEIYSFCLSQPCRFMHDFVRLGFNQTEAGGRAVDGVLNWTGGASGGFFNYRFAQPTRTMRQHIGRWFPERQFPFADQVTYDPVTGQTDGVLRRCLASDTCPKIFEANSEEEYWNKAASLLTTDTQGNDLDLSARPNVRYYLLSDLSHVAATGLGTCQQQQNPLSPIPALRTLLVDLDQWVANGTAPPANQVPTRSDGTLVPALPQSGVGFPSILGVTYTGLTTTGDLFDFGPLFSQGILTTLPPAITVGAYPVFVPKTDADGNDVAGIHLPDVAAPLATYSGWNVRAAAFAGNDMCNATGQMIPFPQTKPARLAAGDTRLSVAERYPSHQAYANAVTQAANNLFAGRFLLADDVQAYINAAAASTVAVDTTPPVLTVPANITAEATGPSGAAVTFSATATDNWDPNPNVVCTPRSGSTFPLGLTTVQCTATDASGNAANGSFTVTVAQPLNPGTTTCNGVADGSGRNVVVPSGAVCTLLAGTQVSHDVQVQQGGTLIDQGAAIGHDLSADHPKAITVAGGSIGHDVQINGLTGAPPTGGDNYVCNITVGHDLSVQNGAATAGRLDVGDPPDCSTGNQVGHDLVVQNNAEPVDVSDNGTAANPIGHDLTVQNNQPGGATVSNNYAGHDATCQQNSPQTGNGNHAAHNNSCPP
jgi:alpha/beta hydrolase family protein/HYR domain-containing protein